MTQVTQLVVPIPLMRQARNLQLAIIDLAKKRDLKPEQFRAHLNAIDMLAREAHDLITIQEDTRSLAQNRMLWACLHDVSSQVVWYGKKLDPESWKHIFSASLKGQETVPGINGGFVVLGQSTSKMRVSEMRDLITLIHAFGAEQNVRFSDESARAAEWAGRFGRTA